MASFRQAGNALRQAVLISNSLRGSTSLQSYYVTVSLLATRHHGAKPCALSLGGAGSRSHASKACFATSSDSTEAKAPGGELQVCQFHDKNFAIAMAKCISCDCNAQILKPELQQLLHATFDCSSSPDRCKKSAANRVCTLAEADPKLKELVEAGVCPKLLAMIKPDVDTGVAQAVLAAIKEISRISEGRDALVEAGAVTVLSQALQQQWLPRQDESVVEATKIRDWLQR